ncbi:MAG: phenylacetate--CoA ligase family protein [Thermosynechococcaceae cyanobacterium]
MSARSPQVVAALQTFLGTSLDTLLQPAIATDPATHILSFFHSVVDTVPAYRDFLRSHPIDPHGIQSLEAFQQLPLLTKANYLKSYPLSQLCRDGRLSDCDLIAMSSGSTGDPTPWPRFITDELLVAPRFEQIFRDSFQSDRRTTLAVVCFALGTWVGGMYTTACCRWLACKGYPITVVTPGNQKTEILRVVQALAPQFEQTVLLGYPPFLKDVIDTGLQQGVPWADYAVKWVMAGEVFSEEWRTLVGQRLGSLEVCFDSASLYGTADAGVLGNETPLSICIRRFLADHPDAAKQLFGESRLPTLVQYDPTHRFFEVQDGTLLFSGENGIPLVRYHIADSGGLIAYPAMLQFLQDWGFDPMAVLPPNRGIRALPFVYVFGRSHFAISYFGANLYPENIAVGLEQPDIQDWVTGKFVMEVLETADRDRRLAIAVELAPGMAASETKTQAIAQSILNQLRRLNSEFANYVPPEYQLPQVTLKPMADPAYFPLGVKHRYTR